MKREPTRPHGGEGDHAALPREGEGDWLCCRVELLGPARLLAGVKEVVVEMESPLAVRDMLQTLATRCPALVGPVLDVERSALAHGYVLNRNGRDFLADSDAVIRPGDTLLLLASTAGG